MYFRSESQGRETPYRIPENYSGSAFSEPEATPEPFSPADTSPEPPGEECHPSQSHPTTPTFLSSLLPPKPRGIRGGLFGDIGTEELLILGLLLLLSQTDSDDDVVLLLLLLLFYK